MNCKFCNAELKEDALFCQECGAKVEDDTSVDTPMYCQCGAELSPGVKFCSQCGAAVTNNGIVNGADIENDSPAAKPRSFPANIIARIKEKPKFFGIIGAAVIVLIVAVSIGVNVFGDSGKPPKSSASSKAGSSVSASSKAGSSASSSKIKSDDYYKVMVEAALLKEVQKKYRIADAGSTKYKINKTETKSGYRIFYGKVYLYDKYGKATTGHSDGSGSYIRTFEVKINTNSNKAISCKIQ